MYCQYLLNTLNTNQIPLWKWLIINIRHLYFILIIYIIIYIIRYKTGPIWLGPDLTGDDFVCSRFDLLPSSKYLGVNISDDLTWKDHIEKTASKANRTVGFLRRNMRDYIMFCGLFFCFQLYNIFWYPYEGWSYTTSQMYNNR